MKLKITMIASIAATVGAASIGLAAANANSSVSASQPGTPRAFMLAEKPWQSSDGTITWMGQTYRDWSDFHARVAPEFWRCGTRSPLLQNGGGGVGPQGGVAGVDGADCGLDSTTPGAADPTNPYYPLNTLTSGPRTREIPVVVHVIRDDSGTLGDIPLSRIQSQITRLNADFAGKLNPTTQPPEPQGFNVALSFKLVAVTTTDNSNWYNDSGDYRGCLAWDTTRYLNIYTNTASGALGYVTGFPAEPGQVGSTNDGVVILSDAFGANPAAAPYDLGRTATHEIGHYFGLYHTFQNGCGPDTSPQCNTTADLICDTAAESSPNFGCPATAPNSCPTGTADPIDNFMDYSDDACMTKFTSEQARRIRCTILTWRADLPRDVTADAQPTYVTATDGETPLTVSWGYFSNTPAQAFEVRRKITGTADATYVTIGTNLPAGTLSYVDATAAELVSYDYQVRARTGAATFSNWVGPDSGFVGFEGPSNVSATDFEYSDRVTITWTAPTSYTPVLYHIYRAESGSGGCGAGGVGTEIGTSTTTNFDDLLTSDTPPEVRVVYSYQVKAEAAGGALSSLEADDGAVAIEAPSNLVATGAVDGTTPPLTDRIKLTWSLPASYFVNRVVVYRSVSDQPFVEVATLNGAVREWSDINVFPNVEYTYYVRAVSSLLGLSGASEPDIGFKLEPASVSSATDGVGNSVVVSWTRPNTWIPSNYAVWRKRSLVNEAWTQVVADLPSTAFRYTDTSVIGGEVYAYAVTAKSALFNSYSDRGRTDTGYPVVTPPAGVSASNSFPAYVLLQWTQTNNPVGVTWEVYRRVAGSNAAFTKIRTVTQPVIYDGTANPGVNYQYYVKARASNGVVSAPSATVVGVRP